MFTALFAMTAFVAEEKKSEYGTLPPASVQERIDTGTYNLSRAKVIIGQWIQDTATGRWWYQHEDGSFMTDDWEQIAVYKTDKTLLELCDNLKPASNLFPAHIHAVGEKAEAGERSLVRLNMLDYSKGKGDNTVSVYANISPEEVKYIYSALFNHLMEFDFPQEKIFGEPDDDGYSIVQKMQINRYETDSQGRKCNHPWIVEIQNGKGIAVKNSNGGKYCKKDSCICERKVRLFLNDKDMFSLFAKAEACVRAFEQEFAFRRNRIGNFNSLYVMLKKEIQAVAERLVREDGAKAA